MLIYWILFLWPTYAAYNVGHVATPKVKLAYWSLAIILILIVGLRYKVGPDWDHYVTNLSSIHAWSLSNAIRRGEPAYWVLNWLARATQHGIWVVNLACAAIYVAGIFHFCRQLHNPWLGIMITVPFMVIVIGMNYPRQSAALGFVFLGLVALQRNQVIRFIALIAAGALFHVTAVAALPFALLIGMPGRYLRWALIGVVIGTICYFLGSRSGQALISNYLVNPMVSGGTVVRVLINTLAAFCIILLGDKMHADSFVSKFWLRYAYSALPFVAAIIALPPLTVLDRLAFYWMPLQVYAFTNLPDAMETVQLRRVVTICTIITYALVMFVWFTFGNYNYAWRPYRFYPFE